MLLSFQKPAPVPVLFCVTFLVPILHFCPDFCFFLAFYQFGCWFLPF